MASYDYDVIVIGSGAGGNIAAQQLSKSGKSVAIVESSTLGGRVPTVSRVPLHALLESARTYESARQGSRFGIRGATVGYNYPSVKAWKDLAVRRTGIHTSEHHLLDSGVNVIHGRAYFINPHTITVGNARFSAQSFIIATGSELVLPDIIGLTQSGFLTEQEAINLTRPPRSIAILGSNSQACEFAWLFAAFGTKVYIVDSAPRLIPKEDPEIADLLELRFTENYSMSLLLEATVERVEKVGLGRRLTVRSGAHSQKIMVDAILLADNRKATTDIGLENAGVKYEDGGILVDNYLKTSAEHIYAVGSCTGVSSEAHLAVYQSQVAVYNITHKKQIFADYRAVPRVLFVNPEIATVGSTEQKLREAKIQFKTVSVPLSVVSRANTADFSEGFVKIIANRSTGVILGAVVVSPQASEVIHELTVAIQNYLTAAQVAQTIHTFSTWSEAVRVVCAKLAKVS